MAGKISLNVTRWRKRLTRSNDIRKLPEEIYPAILYEFVAREMLEMGSVIEHMPREHRDLISNAYRYTVNIEKKMVVPQGGMFFGRNPHILLPDSMGYFYRTIGEAVSYARGRMTIVEAIAECAQKSFGFIDWSTQVRMVQSILAVEQEFGKLDLKTEDHLIANDWLQDRGMEPLVFAETIERLLGKPEKRTKPTDEPSAS